MRRALAITLWALGALCLIYAGWSAADERPRVIVLWAFAVLCNALIFWNDLRRRQALRQTQQMMDDPRDRR